MRLILPVQLLVALLVAPAFAQAPQPLAVPVPQAVVPEAEKLPVEEPAPGFQPLRPSAEEPASEAKPEPPVAPAPEVIPTPAPAPAPAPIPAAVPEPQVGEPASKSAGLPAWAMSLSLVVGALLAGLSGVLIAMILRRGEANQRRRAVAATLATELETRLQAFETVPLPPNAEAGVFFVSAVTSLAGIDAGFRAAQTDLHLLPGRLASHLSVHYAAVQRVADFVKGQSLAAAVRMLQANRMGGHPCPDAGTMRDAHVELGAAFRGLDKLIAGLRAAE